MPKDLVALTPTKDDRAVVASLSPTNDAEDLGPEKDILALRQWCVQAALQWPSDPPYQPPGLASLHQQQPDVIGRARLIEVYVTEDRKKPTRHMSSLRRKNRT